MRWLALFIFTVFPGIIFALEQPLASAADEAKAHEIFKQIKCLVCESGSINESGTEYAKLIRTEIRKRMAAGQTEKQILAWIQEKFGSEALLTNVESSLAQPLYWVPVILLLLSVFIILPKSSVKNMSIVA